MGLYQHTCHVWMFLDRDYPRGCISAVCLPVVWLTGANGPVFAFGLRSKKVFHAGRFDRGGSRVWAGASRRGAVDAFLSIGSSLRIPPLLLWCISLFYHLLSCWHHTIAHSFAMTHLSTSMLFDVQGSSQYPDCGTSIHCGKVGLANLEKQHQGKIM